MCQSPCVGGDSSGPTLELFNRLFKNHGIVSNKANSIINGVLYGLARVLVYSGIDIFSEKCVTDICPP